MSEPVTNIVNIQVEELRVPEQSSKDSRIGQLVISAPDILNGRVDLVVGRAGYPNVGKNLRAGGAILFETPDAGLLEVRVLHVTSAPDTVTVRISRVSPRQGIAAGFVDHEPDNAPFNQQELLRIKNSLSAVSNAVAERSDLTSAQLDLIDRKLDDMAAAAARMGRKDWINLAIGQLTNLIVTAAFGAEVGKFLFSAVGRALSWLVGETIKYLP